MPAPSTCTVSGVIYGPTAAALEGVKVRVMVTTGFTDSLGNYIPAGVLVSTTTAADGTWSLAVIHTQSLLHSVTFVFEYPLGDTQSKIVQYPAVIPDAATANFADLVDLGSGTAALASAPTTDSLPEGLVNLYFTNERAQDAVGLMVASSSKISLVYVDATPSLTADIVAGSLLNADINASAAIALTKLAASTADKVATFNSSGILAPASVSTTTLAFLDATSSVQTQLDAKQGLDSDLTALASNSTNGLWARTGSGTGAARTIAGTSNQVLVANGDGVSGAPTLSLPQDIHSGASPSFAQVLVAADPTSSLQLATKQYVDNLLNGLRWKDPVKVASTGNLTLSGEQTIDGVLTSGSRVLVKDQSTQTQNGIYVSAAGAWARSSDANTGTKLESSAVFVQEGSANADKGFTQTTEPVTIGVSNIVFVQNFGTGLYTADGNGVKISGSTFSLSLDGSTLSQSASGVKVSESNVTHNNLGGLTTGDGHTQYALLAGRSGGQTINGDTASGGNFTLSSTAHATKGKITAGILTIDEANGRVGIRKTSPTYGLHYDIGADDYAKGFAIENSGGGANALWRMYVDLGGPFSIYNPNQTTSAFTAGHLGGLGLAGGNFVGGAEVNIRNNPGKLTMPCLGITALGSQTANLQEWKDSASAILSYIDINGKGFLKNIASTSLSTGIVHSDSSGNFTSSGVTIAEGGTGQTTKAAAFDALSPMSASGDIIYGGTSGTGTRLAKGSDGQVLTLASGVPSWAASGGTGPRSEVSLHAGNGHGSSTGTKIRRFQTTIKNTGTGITYADSSTAGATFTINEAGVYSMHLYDSYSIGGAATGLSLNSTELTTVIASITDADRLIRVDTPAAGAVTCCSITKILAVNDVIRVHDSGAPDGATGANSGFTITKVSA